MSSNTNIPIDYGTREKSNKELGITEDNDRLKKMSVKVNEEKRLWQKRDFCSRERSGRIKRNLENLAPQALQVINEKIPGLTPRWLGKFYPSSRGLSDGARTVLPLSDNEFNLVSPVPQVVLNAKEVISNHDYHRSTRFMNSISEEFEDAVTERPLSKTFPSEHTKIADSKVSSNAIRSVDTLEDLICYGDSAGGVGVYLDERSITLKVHNEPVTRTLFLKDGQGNGILSASQDGTVRLTDLVRQEVSVKYSWIQSGDKEQIGWIEPWDGNNFLVNANRNSLKRIDLRSKNVDKLVSLSPLDYRNLRFHSQFELLSNMSHDPAFGANIKVHPSNRNLVSFCHESK